ncbi:hypothetical protein BLOT_003469 [Blomia tropicalis]|nr:hypothetical protein BLOT_003469 [Blomia tropicalis]
MKLSSSHWMNRAFYLFIALILFFIIYYYINIFELTVNLEHHDISTNNSKLDKRSETKSNIAEKDPNTKLFDKFNRFTNFETLETFKSINHTLTITIHDTKSITVMIESLRWLTLTSTFFDTIYETSILTITQTTKTDVISNSTIITSDKKLIASNLISVKSVTIITTQTLRTNLTVWITSTLTAKPLIITPTIINEPVLITSISNFISNSSLIRKTNNSKILESTRTARIVLTSTLDTVWITPTSTLDPIWITPTSTLDPVWITPISTLDPIWITPITTVDLIWITPTSTLDPMWITPITTVEPLWITPTSTLDPIFITPTSTLDPVWIASKSTLDSTCFTQPLSNHLSISTLMDNQQQKTIDSTFILLSPSESFAHRTDSDNLFEVSSEKSNEPFITTPSLTNHVSTIEIKPNESKREKVEESDTEESIEPC